MKENKVDIFLDEIIEEAEKLVGKVGDVSLTTTFPGIGLDSLDLMALIMAIEERHEPAVFLDCHTKYTSLGDMVRVLEEQLC